MFVQKRNWSMKNNKLQKPYTKIYGERYGDLALSIKGDSETSLADKRILKKLPRYEYAWRSALLPGWGQYHNDRQKTSLGYFSASLLLTGYWLSNVEQLDKLRSAYKSSPILPYSADLGETFGINLFMKESKKSAFNTQYSKTLSIYTLMMGFWAWNIFDSYYFSKEDDSLSVSFDYRTRSVFDFNVETYGSLQFGIRF